MAPTTPEPTQGEEAGAEGAARTVAELYEVDWPDYEYIKWQPWKLRRNQPRKTGVWMCFSKRTGDELGLVQWYAPWRRYCYYPTTHTVYSDGCLTDIADFIDRLMKKRKEMHGS